jgi:hypothetical protein
MADNRANESQNEKWLDSLKDLVAVVLKSKEGDNSFLVATRLLEKLRESGLPLPAVLRTQSIFIIFVRNWQKVVVSPHILIPISCRISGSSRRSPWGCLPFCPSIRRASFGISKLEIS